MSPRARVELFFDVISPYSWIAFEALTRYRNVWNIDLVLRPFFLGGVMRASGNRPPAMQSADVPNKMTYMGEDLRRNARYWGVPLRMMADPFDAMFNKGSMSSQRLLVSLQHTAPDYVEAAAREMWLRRWSRDEDIHLTEHLKQICSTIGLAPLLAEEAISRVEHLDTKKALKLNTDEACESHRAFGAPWIVLHKTDGKPESYFGSDRMPFIAHSLGEKYPGACLEHSKLLVGSKL